MNDEEVRIQFEKDKKDAYNAIVKKDYMYFSNCPIITYLAYHAIANAININTGYYDDYEYIHAGWLLFRATDTRALLKYPDITDVLEAVGGEEGVNVIKERYSSRQDIYVPLSTEFTKLIEGTTDVGMLVFTTNANVERPTTYCVCRFFDKFITVRIKKDPGLWTLKPSIPSYLFIGYYEE